MAIVARRVTRGVYRDIIVMMVILRSEYKACSKVSVRCWIYVHPRGSSKLYGSGSLSWQAHLCGLRRRHWDIPPSAHGWLLTQYYLCFLL